MTYDPSNWYWIVNSSTTQVYSSAGAGLVSITDAAYEAWVSAGNLPSQIGAMADLEAVLVAQYPAGMLAGYAAQKQAALAVGGYTVTIGGQAYTFATDAESELRMTGKSLRLQQSGAPTANFSWPLANGAGLSIAPADFIKVAEEVADFVQATSDLLLLTIMPAISSGAITTKAEIDAAAWPSNVSATAA